MCEIKGRMEPSAALENNPTLRHTVGRRSETIRASAVGGAVGQRPRAGAAAPPRLTRQATERLRKYDCYFEMVAEKPRGSVLVEESHVLKLGKAYGCGSFRGNFPV